MRCKQHGRLRRLEIASRFAVRAASRTAFGMASHRVADEVAAIRVAASARLLNSRSIKNCRHFRTKRLAQQRFALQILRLDAQQIFFVLDD